MGATEKSSYSSFRYTYKMPYTEEVINPILEEWLTTEKIEFTVRNELFVK